MEKRPLEVCGICEKLIYPDEPRIYFGRKALHGPCFVQHCKENVGKPLKFKEGK